MWSDELHYPGVCAAKDAKADDVAGVRLNPVFQQTGVIQTRRTGFVHSQFTVVNLNCMFD